MYLRKVSKQKQMVSLDEPLNVDSEGNELILFDLLPSEENCPQDTMDKSTEKEILWRVINRLNEREKEIVNLRYFVGKTQMEVSEEIGISQAQVSRLEKNAIDSIKKHVCI